MSTLTTALAASIETLDLPREALRQGMDLVDLLVTTRLANDRSDARHLIRSAKARMNGRVVAHEGVTAGLDDLDINGLLRLTAGDGTEMLVRAA
ncbi:hypothetical protein [Ferrovibrio sp.]|uniref:hypothetical protein n=1 Tax=Ferrovibrio sp. TaxID=1917215 RepID=UPI003D29FAC3